MREDGKRGGRLRGGIIMAYCSLKGMRVGGSKRGGRVGERRGTRRLAVREVSGISSSALSLTSMVE